MVFAVYCVHRCAIRLDAKVYSAQITSQTIPANINDVFLIGVHREFRGLWQNKQRALEQKLALAARHWKASFCTLKMLKAGIWCVLYSDQNLIKLNNCCTVKRRLPGGEKCPSSSCALLSEKHCCHVLFQLMRQDWITNFPFLIVSHAWGLLLLNC